MRRVVITGQGIVSSLGNNTAEVTDSLRHTRSGLKANARYAELGMRSHISGRPSIDLEASIDRRVLRFMGDAAAYSYLAMQQAIAQSGLTPEQVSHPRSGLVAGSGGASSLNQVWAADTLRAKGIKRVGPMMVTRTMGSTVSACLATPFAIKGVNYSITSACSTSAHCIGHAAQLIAWGQQDVVFAGGGEEESWELSMLFDAMGAMSTRNDDPARAARAFDASRDGFVIAGGGGMLVLESLEHAQARGATILAELVGFGATSDGHDMVAPSGEGAVRCMQQALATVKTPVDYVNAHGTSTPVGDVAELGALRQVFSAAEMPAISSTKSISGHSLGAAGVQEAIYSLLMLQGGFLAASAHIEQLDPAAEGLPILREVQERQVNTVMSNSFGFGGTNATLVFSRFAG